MRDLTERQEQILVVIRQSLRERGIPPTLREICAATGMSSTNAAHEQLEALEKKGVIERIGKNARGIRLIESDSLDVGDLSATERQRVKDLLREIRAAVEAS